VDSREHRSSYDQGAADNRNRENTKWRGHGRAHGSADVEQGKQEPHNGDAKQNVVFGG
jgi:hypothetical protein